METASFSETSPRKYKSGEILSEKTVVVQYTEHELCVNSFIQL